MWTLISPNAADEASSKSFDLPKDGSAHIVVTGFVIGVVRKLLPGAARQAELGRVTVGPWGVKLEAVLEPLTIIPGHAHADLITSTAGGSDAVKYKLSPRSAELSEILILRHGDVICFARSAHSLICKWIASEVQVNSSAAETRAIELPTSNVNEETFEEDTEDEDLDEATEVAIATYRPKATPVPRLSNQISVVVQETPTADRIVGTMEFTSAHETNKYDPASTNDAVSSGVADSAEDEAETYTTAHTKDLPLVTMNDVDASVHAPIARSASAPAESADEKAPQRSPRVEIPQRASRKRDSPTTNDEDHDDDKRSIIRSNKRTKRDVDDQNDTQDSRMSNIDVDETKKSKTVVVAKGKKRKSEVSETRAESPPRSQRSSQRSNATVANGTPYEGPAPRVAVSNSSITKTSQAVKFLKKHGGSLIESTEEPFNILCVRNGELLKTSKLLLSIARGTSIVTDKWLLNSAKAGHFLAISPYIPSAPKQEQEWNIHLDQVIGKPQTPFSGYTIYFTKSLKATYAAFSEIEHVCKAAGATKIATTMSRVDKDAKIIVLAKEEDDAEMEKLIQDGITCYHKDLITQSILRGVVDLNSAEFKIEMNVAPKKDKDKKKKRQKSK